MEDIFTERTLKILLESGWRPDRLIDLNLQSSLLIEEGYTLYPTVTTFLESFAELQIEFFSIKKGSKDNFHFDAVKAAGDISKGWILDEYSSRVNEKLCIIGQAFTEHMALCMSPSGKVYGGYDDFLIFIGESGTEAIENICQDKTLKEIL